MGGQQQTHSSVTQGLTLEGWDALAGIQGLRPQLPPRPLHSLLAYLEQRRYCLAQGGNMPKTTLNRHSYTYPSPE